MGLRFVQSTIDQYAVDYVYYVRDDGETGWFIPFQDQRCHAVQALGNQHLLAIGAKGGVTILDCLSGQRAPMAKDFGHVAAHHPRTVSPVKPLVYIAAGKDRVNAVRELAFDGSSDRTIPVFPEFFAANIGARADGKVNLYGMLGYATPGPTPINTGLVVLDPATGDMEIQPWPHFKMESNFSFERIGLKWFSPSGDHVLRSHLGSIPRRTPSVRSALAGLFGKRPPPFEGHPDLIEDGQTRYGIALDVYSTAPFGLAQRLVTRFLTAEDIADNAARSGWAHDACVQQLAIINQLADQVDFSSWDGQSQLLFANREEKDETKRQQITQRDFATIFLVGQIKDVVWADDSRSMTVIFQDGKQRTVSLAGDIGPLVPTPELAWLKIPPAITKAVGKRLRDRHEQRIPLKNLSEAECVRTIERMGALLEAGLERIVHRDNLTFVFTQGGGGSLSEEEFFAHVASSCPSAVAALRALLLSFGRQAAAAFKSIGGEQIRTGTEPESEHTALAFAALALARLDPTAHEALAGWFDHVDQEHDGFAANEVFPAMVRKAGWLSPEFVRFAIRFFMRLQASPDYDPREIGFMQALRQNWSTADFAKVVTEEALRWKDDRRKYSDGDKLTLESMTQDLLLLLDDTVPWDRTARRELAFALRVAQGTGPWGNVTQPA